MVWHCIMGGMIYPDTVQLGVRNYHFEVLDTYILNSFGTIAHNACLQLQLLLYIWAQFAKIVEPVNIWIIQIIACT